MPSIDGIVSGLDTSALIDAIVDAVAGPKYLMEEELGETEELQDKVAGIKNRLEDMVDTMEAMDTETEFPAFASTLSDEGYVDVTLDSDAIPGVYEIDINALASAESEVADGVDDSTVAGIWGSGDVVIDYGTESFTITLDGTEDLDDIAELISDEADGLSAYVMDTGESSANYRLVVAGEDTGAANTVDIDTSGLSGGTVSPTFTETVSAGDAEATVNGVTVYSEDSVFDDAIQGISFTALQVSTDATTVSVTRDDTALTDKVQGFVDAYNEVISYYNTNTSYDVDLGIQGALVGDSTVRNIIGKIGDLVTGAYEIPDLDLVSLAQVGISTGTDGKLEFDTAVFADQLDERYDDVAALFTYDNGSGDQGPLATLRDQISDVYINSDGLLEEKEESIEGSIEDLEDRISDFEERLESYTERLRDQFTTMETVLAEIQASQSYLTALFSSAESE